MRHPKRIVIALALVAGIAAFARGGTRAENIDPGASSAKHAYSENVGWLNAEPSGAGGPGVRVSKTKLTGYIWGENIGWINLSCHTNATCGAVNYGVVNDGLGVLSGYAWAENVGWINMSCLTNNTCATSTYGVIIDPWTGVFSGKAWGENVGWISFSWGSGAPATFRVQTSWACPYDLNRNTTVNFSDLLIFAGAYGSTPSSTNWNALADFNRSDQVTFADLLLFASHYTQTLVACLPV